MRLNWIKLYTEVDEDTMEGAMYEPEKKLFSGRFTIRFCSICKGWVSSDDYQTKCLKNHHDQSEKINPVLFWEFKDAHEN